MPATTEQGNPAAVAQGLIRVIKSRFLNARGLLSRTFPPSERTLFDNFDDLVPFLLYFGEEEFLVDQIRRAEDVGAEGLLAENNLVYSYRIDEYLGGLYAVWRKTRAPVVRRVLDRDLERIRAMFLQGDHLAGTYDVRTGKRSAHYFSRSAGLLETFLEMTPDYPGLISDVMGVADHWLDGEFFNRWGLFPQRDSAGRFRHGLNRAMGSLGFYKMDQPQVPARGPGRRRQAAKAWVFDYFTSGYFASLMKSNTTFIFTLAALSEKSARPRYGSAIRRWVECALDTLVEGGNVYGEYYPLQDKRTGVSLTNAFILVDVLLECRRCLQGPAEWVQRAGEIVDAQWNARWETGLLPMFPGADRDHLDNQVDFAVSLRRYGEAVGDPRYQERSRDLLLAALRHHRAPEGYYTHVDRSGRPLRVGEVNAVDPKYNGLLLKGLICLMTMDQKITEHPELHDLFKDR